MKKEPKSCTKRRLLRLPFPRAPCDCRQARPLRRIFLQCWRPLFHTFPPCKQKNLAPENLSLCSAPVPPASRRCIARRTCEAPLRRHWQRDKSPRNLSDKASAQKGGLTD